MATKIETKTPFGEDCIIPRGNEELENIINAQVKGCYQEAVARSLIWDGYVVAYKADGDVLKGKAKQYQGRYMESLTNLMDRMHDTLIENGHYLVSGEVGPRGAFGYYLSK